MTTSKTVRYQYIDALRGWAILGVVATHVVALSSISLNTKVSLLLEALMTSGLYGVQLFFVISAFTVFFSFKRTINSHPKQAIQSFLIKRLFRIIPIYYIGIVILVLFLEPLQSWWGLITNLLFIHDFFPPYINFLFGGWSIGVEVTFYLCVPILWKYVNSLDKAVRLLIISMLLHSFCSYFVKELPVEESFLFRYFPSQFPLFCIGICYYFFIEGDHTVRPSTLLAIAGYIFIYFATKTFLLFPTQYFFGVCFFLSLYVLSQKPYLFFVNPVTVFFGKISYSLYLSHFFVIHLVSSYQLTNLFVSPSFLPFDINHLYNFLIVIVLSSGISYLSYLFIEQPTTKLGHKLASR